MLGTPVVDGAAKQVKVHTLVAGSDRPGPSSAGFERQTHSLAADPAGPMAEVLFLGR